MEQLSQLPTDIPDKFRKGLGSAYYIYENAISSGKFQLFKTSKDTYYVVEIKGSTFVVHTFEGGNLYANLTELVTYAESIDMKYIQYHTADKRLGCLITRNVPFIKQLHTDGANTYYLMTI